jgi:hypothetical protein
MSPPPLSLRHHNNIREGHWVRTRRCLLPALLVLGVGLAAAGIASAQQGPEGLFRRTVGDLKVVPFYEGTLYPDRPVSGQGTDMGMSQHRVRLVVPLFQEKDRFEWAALGGVKLLSVDTGAILPDTGEAFPDRLWDVDFGTAARWKLENGWILGGAVTVRSASDAPFATIHETAIQADALLRVPWRDSLAWIFLLNYSTLREILPDIPLPGVALAYEPGPYLRLLVGMPFTVRWIPIDGLEFSATYVILRTVRSRASYRIIGPFSVYAGFEWDSQRFFRSDRSEEDARLTYYEKRVGGGIRWNVTPVVYLDAGGGYAFDRFWFEGKTYQDRHTNRIDLADGPFAMLRAGVQF